MMNNGKILRLSLIGIAIFTIVSGLLQMVLPSLVLYIVSAEVTPTSQHFFAIIGMFMLLFNGALLQALISLQPQPIVLIWAGLQKFGASIAVCLAVIKLIFSPFALLIAGFDLLSGVLIFWYLLRLRTFTPGYTYEQPTA
ncbi:MAG: hypothetical protein V7K69_07460 [Nostoc sp.]|uniref:hypothetical protein n=1 Tax=Nostoc sp. TaxID=1180 RepID=UPI002FF656F4